MKIGLLCGREYSFPPAFIEKVNELGKRDNVTAEFVHLGGVRMGEPAQYRVIVRDHDSDFRGSRRHFKGSFASVGARHPDQAEGSSPESPFPCAGE